MNQSLDSIPLAFDRVVALIRVDDLNQARQIFMNDILPYETHILTQELASSYSPLFCAVHEYLFTESARVIGLASKERVFAEYEDLLVDQASVID